MTTTPDLATLAGKLSQAQRRWVADAQSIDLDGPALGFVVLDDGPDPLPAELANTVSGKLTPLGEQVRNHLKDAR